MRSLSRNSYCQKCISPLFIFHSVLLLPYQGTQSTHQDKCVLQWHCLVHSSWSYRRIQVEQVSGFCTHGDFKRYASHFTLIFATIRIKERKPEGQSLTFVHQGCRRKKSTSWSTTGTNLTICGSNRMPVSKACLSGGFKYTTDRKPLKKSDGVLGWSWYRCIRLLEGESDGTKSTVWTTSSFSVHKSLADRHVYDYRITLKTLHHMFFNLNSQSSPELTAYGKWRFSLKY